MAPQGQLAGQPPSAAEAGQGRIQPWPRAGLCALGCPFDQKVASAPGLILAAPTIPCGPDRKMFTAAKFIVGGNRKTITATNFDLQMIEVGSYQQTVAGNAMVV